MILTGRAKDDFLSWYGTGEHYFTTTLKPIEQYANIVEWLDVVGLVFETRIINVHIRTFEIEILSIYKTIPSTYTGLTKGRQQATEAAIKLADKIYNNENTI